MNNDHRGSRHYRLTDLPIGLYEKALPEMDWPEILAQARNLGFEFVEMSLDESDHRLARLEWTREQRRRFVDHVHASGIRVPSICLSGTRRYPPGSSDPELREEGRRIFRKTVDLASDIGVRVVQVMGYDVYDPEPSTPESKERFIQALAEAVAYAAGRGVMLAVEVMDTKFMSSISRVLYCLKRIQSPWMAIYPDLGNLSAWNDNASEELELGLRLGLVAAIHLKDTYPVTADSPGQFRDVPFGQGCVDFIRLFRILRQHRYSGQFLLEMWNRTGPGEIAAVAEAREWLQERMRQIDAE